ncbi:uncharacterized protein FPRN_10148 [Fusarium proliferatum]|nr:uncharacterized protein FPRN_10148 [Fusarium proliferatum]
MSTPLCELEGNAPVSDSFAALVASGAQFPMARHLMTQAQQDQQQQLASEVSTTYEPTTTIWIRNFNQLCDTPPAVESRLPFFSRDHYKHERVVPDSKSRRFVESMRRYRRHWRELAPSAQNWRSSGDSWPPPLPRRTRNKLRKRQRPDGY